MKALAIISEYNPFHNGHKYQLEAAKEITGADYSISLMSGNFLQRGEPAYWDKYTRSTMALYGGLDLVLELPFCYAAGSAKDFACGAVSILNSLNSVNYLCFGAEDDDFKLFDTISDIIINEAPEYKSLLQAALKQGNSYAKARTAAIAEILKDETISLFLNQPNNILALEYVCALKTTNSSIKPVIIKRVNAGYKDTSIYNSISSASAIRSALYNDGTRLQIDTALDMVSRDIPDTTLKLIEKCFGKTSPVYADDLQPFIISALIHRSNTLSHNELCGDFTDICDINKDISDKLNKLTYPLDCSFILDNLNGRQYTGTRISRALLHLIFNYTDAKRNAFIEEGYALYANILGIKKEKSSYLREIKEISSIPLITKKADFEKNISAFERINPDTARLMWQLDIMASRLYNQLVYDRYGTVLKDDFCIKLPVI